MNNKIIYGIIILCIVFTILIGASVLSTGYKIADFLLALFLSAIGLYLMYKNIETAKVAPDPNPNSSSGIVDNENLDNENIDKTLLGVLKVKMSYEIIISKFESSLSNMQTLENNIYLEKYKEYKNKINDELKILQDLPTLDHNKNFLTELINTNIYIQTINKYKDTDENLNNINELYEHFINMYKIDAKDNYSYKDDLNLIENLQKLKKVILSIENNASYIYQFDSLISSRFHKDPDLNGNGTSLKESAWKLIFSDDLRKTKYGKGEGDSKIMQEFINNHNKCYNKIETYLIGNTDEEKKKNYNNLMQYIRGVYDTEIYDTEGYYEQIEQYIKKNTPLDTFENWINTCIIPYININNINFI